MKGNCFIPIWTEGMRIIKEVLNNNPNSSNQSGKRDAFARIIEEYESRADNLHIQMVDTAHRGLLDLEFLDSIQERWMRLDEIVKWYYDLCNRDIDEDEPQVFRRSPTWLVADSELRWRTLIYVAGQKFEA
jgi:hypothetical protein